MVISQSVHRFVPNVIFTSFILNVISVFFILNVVSLLFALNVISMSAIDMFSSGLSLLS
ncbi:hypothetical protein PC121_g23133 [Phytophthora cactorum]|nr:hypothetical protein PC120_g25322 [Phytophthora cactorum]KAG3042295.1 hypothetical protein PC121_g23133 [Phytophthora cactorum]